MKVPTYEACAAKPSTERTALEQFVYHNEPAGIKDEILFRDGLRQVIEEVIAVTKRDEP